MPQMQNMIDFLAGTQARPARSGRGDADELAGEQIFFSKGRCAACHLPQTSFLGNNMRDLKLERFHRIGQIVNDLVMLPDGKAHGRLAPLRAPVAHAVSAGA